jgi:hypothetical protein
MKEKNKYDSTEDTLKHILRVQKLMLDGIGIIAERARVHDQSKLKSPEKEYFDKAVVLKDLTYNSPEYHKSLEDLKPGIEHHYKYNSHHPQHYENGIDGFDLFDLIECFYDWKASGERNAGGSIYDSIEINKTRFKMSDQLVSIFKNTAKNLKY